MAWVALGYIGDALFVLSHFLLSTGRIKVGVPYQLLQIAAAFTLGLSALMAGFYPTTVLELIWIGISFVAIRRLRNEPKA